MAELATCQSCRGSKKVLGLGMIEQTCEACKGIGYVEIETITAPALETKEEVIVNPVVEQPIKKTVVVSVNTNDPLQIIAGEICNQEGNNEITAAKLKRKPGRPKVNK